MLGAVGGSVLGDRIEGSPEPEWRTVQRCTTQTVYENRTVAYNVVYEFAGKQYTAQMPHDPGPTLALQIGPVGANTTVQPQSYAADIPVYSDPPAVVRTQPAYPSYPSYPIYPIYSPPPSYYPPVTFDFGFGYWGGDYRHGYRGYRGYRDHRHWR